VFSLQVILDVIHVLRENTRKGLKEFQFVGDRALKSVQGYLDYAEKYPNEREQDNDAFVKSLKSQIATVMCQDCMAENVYPQQLVNGVYQTLQRPPYAFLSELPVLCGTMALRFELMVQNIDDAILASSVTLVSCAHFYNAARQKN